jgi:hypothetical protein
VVLLSFVSIYFSDGEVDSFKLITLSQAANIIRQTEFYKPNCCLVILDFLIRHGFSLSFLSLSFSRTHFYQHCKLKL